MIEDGNDIPIGIIMSISIYTIYSYAINELVQMYKINNLATNNLVTNNLVTNDSIIDNLILFVIYFVPLIILYVETPILLKRFS